MSGRSHNESAIRARAGKALCGPARNFEYAKAESLCTVTIHGYACCPVNAFHLIKSPNHEPRARYFDGLRIELVERLSDVGSVDADENYILKRILNTLNQL